MFFEIARAIKEVQPSYVLLENVKGLFSHDGGQTFGTIIQTLDELGFFTEWGLFNSKYWGVPQNRERVYILATRKDKFKEPLLFDLVKQQTEVTTRLIDVLEDEVDEKYYLSEEKTRKLTLDHDLGGKLNMYNYKELDRVHSVNKVSPTLNTMQGGDRQPKIAIPTLTPDRVNKRQNGRRFKEDGEPMFTLTSQDRHGVAIREATKKGHAVAEPGDSVNYAVPTSKTRRGRVGKGIANTLDTGCQQGVVVRTTVDGFHLARTDEKKSSVQGTHVTYPEGNSHCLSTAHKPMTVDGFRIRKLTPLECWRLQGFTDEQFYKAKNDGVSNSQLYKQAGNSVTVNVIDAIARKLI